MKAKLLVIAILIGLGAGAIFIFKDGIINFYYEISGKLSGFEKENVNFLAEKVQKEVITPGPLKKEEESAQAFLTRPGVIQWTNIQRKENNLAPLSENENLNNAAAVKVQDMLARQYFAHISPQGLGAGNFTETSGYEYITIGENLAMGDFANDQELVQAWMDSPGHRANILNPRYQEIGVAVGRGLLEGKSTWLAVQIFGLSLSVCPQPNESLRIKIESYDAQLERLNREIGLLLREIKSMQPKRGAVYNKKISEYNELINQYNSLLELNRGLVDEYNNQVKLFNECAIK